MKIENLNPLIGETLTSHIGRRVKVVCRVPAIELSGELQFVPGTNQTTFRVIAAGQPTAFFSAPDVQKIYIQDERISIYF